MEQGQQSWARGQQASREPQEHELLFALFAPRESPNCVLINGIQGPRLEFLLFERVIKGGMGWTPGYEITIYINTLECTQENEVHSELLPPESGSGRLVVLSV